MEWLNNIDDSCIEYGLKFPKRILHAFHTALKTSEWSPITVLAGVSGTGKSELPRLYSHFGGINFMSLAVQPNWDSKESMLGFFNSIDNKFDAQPVLRLLAQSQKEATSEYPLGLSDSMVLILMDEMNLAHIEMYFAEFLSKFELRRGLDKDIVPDLDVNIGAGIEPYHLPLGRNVLWTGTMNQDETTKSLSDKVLDRGIIINFPRPIHLERRKKLIKLPKQTHILRRSTWDKWWSKETSFTDEEISPFIGFVEEMNESLAKVGRALGHRVWQSIEYYMSNYPAVMLAKKTEKDALIKKAMRIAFEDQLVQKVMPKMQGIETTGTSKVECLDKIRAQLDENNYSIVEDFDISCSLGYGQFIWRSANYLTGENGDDALDLVLNQCTSTVTMNSTKSKGTPSVVPKKSVKPTKSKPKETSSVVTNKLVKPTKSEPKETSSAVPKKSVKSTKSKPKETSSVMIEKLVLPSKKINIKNAPQLNIQDCIRKGIIPHELIQYAKKEKKVLHIIPLYKIIEVLGCTTIESREIRDLIRKKRM